MLAAKPSPVRHHHLDFLRGWMMLLGVFVHASHADYELGDYEWIRFLSGSFRMGAFFAVSGFFVPMLLERHGARAFIAKRWTLLGVPALFAILVLNPPAIWLMNRYFETAPAHAELRIDWHVHVWFLLDLMVYTAAAPALLAIIRTVPRILGRWVGEGAGQLGLLTLITLAAAFAMKVGEKWGPMLPGFDAISESVDSTCFYLPFFAGGVMMGASPRAFAFAHARILPWLLLAPGLLWLRNLMELRPVTSAAEHLLHLGVDYATMFDLSLLVLAVSQRGIKVASPWVRLVSESAYTIYLVHYLLVSASLTVCQRLGLSIPWRALIASVVGMGGGLLLHRYGVSRFPLLAFLFNGRTPGPGKGWSFAGRPGRIAAPNQGP